MKKILITGSGGFIGKNLVEFFEDKYEVHHPRSFELDLSNGEHVKKYLSDNNFDMVIHAANKNSTRNKTTTPYKLLDENLRMFFNLARCNGLYDKMYYFGSGAEYDMNHYIPSMQENYLGTYIPQDPYGFSKYIMSEYSSKCDNIYDLTLFGVFGKYEEWERRFISNAICRALSGLPITIHKNVYFDYLWIDDLSNISGWFLENTPQYRHYNVCTGKKVDLYSLACKVKEITDISCEIIIEEEGLKPEYTGSNNRLIQEFGKYSFIDYSDSIKSLVEYYRTCIHQIDVSRL